jgi:hypothetical protein
MFELRAQMMAANTYLPATARLAIVKKDLTVIGDFASGLACPTPLFALSASLYTAALAMGHDAEDTAVICAVLEKWRASSAEEKQARIVAVRPVINRMAISRHSEGHELYSRAIQGCPSPPASRLSATKRVHFDNPPGFRRASRLSRRPWPSNS